MIYKDHEIFARVWQSGSALYEIDDDGNFTDEVDGCDIVHDDQQIVWYEVEAVDPVKHYTTMYVELETLDEAKRIVDESLKYTKTLA